MIETVRIPNSFNIKKVHWESKEVECFCPLGQDWCTHKFVIDTELCRYNFDFYLLDDWINENIAGHKMTMEESAHTLYAFIVKEIEPCDLSVKEYNGASGYVVEV